MKKRNSRKILSGILSMLFAVQGICAVPTDAVIHPHRMSMESRSMAAEDAFSISGGTVITDFKQGTPVIVKGIVTSAESLLSELTIGIYTEDGTPVIEQTVLPNAESYDLYRLDSSMSFNLLEVGSYVYRVTVSNMEYRDYILVNQGFSVLESDAPRDALTITGGCTMQDIAQGSGVEITGTVHSAETLITSLTVGVFNADGEMLTGTTVQPDDWFCNLNHLDDQLLFDQLPVGLYYYQVSASNTTFQDCVLVNQSFSVYADTSVSTESTPATTETTPASSASETTASSETSVLPPETIIITTAIIVTETTTTVTETTTAPVTTASTETTVTTETTVSAESTAATTDYQYNSISAKGVSLIPTLREGENTALSGIVSCSKANLDALTALVYNANGETVLLQNAYPEALSYDLSQLTLPFATLSAGSYSFKVFVSVQGSGALPIIHQTFLVTEGTAPPAPAEDHLTLTDGMDIPNIVKGTPLLVSGRINSELSDITQVSAGIYDVTGTLVSGGSASPDARTYDLRALDTLICFNLLEEGNYEYRVTAGNAAFPDMVLVREYFTVEEPAAAAPLTITGSAPIVNMMCSDPIHVSGVIQSSGQPITEVILGVYRADGEQVSVLTFHPDAASFTLSCQEARELFAELAPGDYEYRVTASTAEYVDYLLVNQQFHVTVLTR